MNRTQDKNRNSSLKNINNKYDGLLFRQKKCLINFKKFNSVNSVNKTFSTAKKNKKNFLNNLKKNESSKYFSKNNLFPFKNNKVKDIQFFQYNTNKQKTMRQMISFLEKKYYFLQYLNKNDESLLIKNLTRNSNFKKKIILINQNRSKNSDFDNSKNLKKSEFSFIGQHKNHYLPFSYKSLQNKFKRFCSFSKKLKKNEESPSLFYFKLQKEIDTTNRSYYDKSRKKNYIFISCQNIDDNKNSFCKKKEKSMNTDFLFSKITSDKKSNKLTHHYRISSVNNKGKYENLAETTEKEIYNKYDNIMNRNILVYHKN